MAEIEENHDAAIMALLDEIRPQADQWRKEMKTLVGKKCPYAGKRPGMPKNGKNMHYGRNMKNGPGMPLGRMLTPDAFLLWNPDEPLPFFNRTNTTEQNMYLNIYPNPASGQVQFSVEPEQETTIGFRIFDKDGNEVLSVDPENTPAGLYSVTIDVSSLTNGLYIVKATSGQMSAIGRLIVKH